MERVPVQSSNLVSVGYDAETLTLEVEFLRSGIYQYSGVPVEIHEGLLNAGSKGAFFNQAIKKGGYPCSKVG